ncbi:hypothetical protein [Variovorax paradoxus]|uniref:hypothetical protein n=1 Tax=Variovorax paradoxus TaxID=34073 RepID=UPI00248036B0|nr:hypothetical protein [Variovorax paradoxus]WGT63720.1 hypothetical protein QHG62_27450 [Variovorax paradoxus]
MKQPAQPDPSSTPTSGGRATSTHDKPQLSPVNIEQNRQVGIDSPAKGSRMGREANKPSGDPGERGEEADAPAAPHSTSR